MARRVFITAVAVVVGWIAGVYAYVGLLYAFDDGPGEGGIHVGVLFLGLTGMIALGFAGWHLSGRREDSDE